MPPDTDLPNEIVRLMETLVRRSRRGATLNLAGLSITPAQARVLEVMARAGGPLRVSQLAAELDILPRSATSVADELEAHHLIERRPDRRDRRAVLVTLTTEGAAIASDIAGRASSAVAIAIADLPQPDQEHLTATLTTVAGALGRPARAFTERPG